MRYLLTFAMLGALARTAGADDLNEAEWQERYARKLGQIAMIDGDIRRAEGQQTSGLIKMGIGAGIFVVTAATLFPRPTVETRADGSLKVKRDPKEPLFYGGVTLGFVVESWGTWQWWAGWLDERDLKRRRFDVQYGAAGSPGLTLVSRF